MVDPLFPDRASTVRGRAAHWVARSSADDRAADDDVKLAAWLSDDPDHADVFAEQMELWDAAGALADDPMAHTMLLGRTEGLSAGRRFGRKSAIYALIGACAASLMVVSLGTLNGGDGDHFVTTPGEQRSVKLADGSVVTLDTGSAVDVRLSRSERRLVLRSGQAFFEVKKDAARPFRVFVGDSEVRAIGTAFSVRKEGARARVFLAHGTVSIRDPGTPPVILKPGEQAEMAPATRTAVVKIDPDRAMAWRFGRLMFDATPLAVAVAEVNRYGGRQIMLSDPALGRVRISGVFHTREPEAFVETVVAIFPVRLSEGDKQKIVLVPSS